MGKVRNIRDSTHPGIQIALQIRVAGLALLFMALPEGTDIF